MDKRFHLPNLFLTSYKVRTLLERGEMRSNEYFDVSESYVDLIEGWLSEQHEEFRIADVAALCLKIDQARLSRNIQTRIGIALRQLGCRRIEKRKNAEGRYWYRPPQQKLAHIGDLSVATKR